MLGRLDSAIYKTNNGIKVKQDRINSTIGRLGVAAGWADPDKKGSFFAKVSVLNDWDAESTVRYAKDGRSRKYTEDMGAPGSNTRWVAPIT